MNYRLTYEKDKVPKSTRKNVKEVKQQSITFEGKFAFVSFSCGE